ncbi:hypothetical protein IFM89_021097 [Coptis chinensis]|uniref:Protein EXECUTER 1, chloroplastic n=1 Tax=Coptis chinensis TaxID=261450 RepID=A0A835LW50_9MAGN|nr:hypothetical protein IFM89_021097 [Coptis chinensis]
MAAPFPTPFQSPSSSSSSPYTTDSSKIPRHHNNNTSFFKSPTSSSLSRHFPPLKKSSFHSHRVCYDTSFLCRCSSYEGTSGNNNDKTWNSQFGDVVKSVVKKIEDYLNRSNDVGVSLEEKVKEKEEEEVDDDEWDWERWKKHFVQVEEQEKIVSVLKSQLGDAVYREEYEYAAKLKVAIAAATANDTLGRVINHFNRAIEEGRYQDAAFYRDHAGAGLMGWWAGISEDSDDPYGRIICIGVEHGRYVARSFSPRHLATAAPGVPLFEIFITMGSKGEYKQQAVYLKRNGGKSTDSTPSSRLLDPSSNTSQLNGSTDAKNERSATSTEDIEDRDDDSDMAEGLAGSQNILQDMTPVVKVTVLKVTTPGDIDKDLISEVIEQIIEDEEDNDEEEEEEEEEEEDDEEKDVELEIIDTDDDNVVKAENHQDEDEIEVDAGDADSVSGKDRSQMAVKFVIGGRLPKPSSNRHAKTFLRVPARLERKDRVSFSFSVEKDEKQIEVGRKGIASPDKTAALQGQRSINHVMSDLAKFALNREKIPMKVLKDVEELISLTLSQAKNRQPLSGTTSFNRIEIPETPDLLNGLYIGAHGAQELYTSEVIHLSRKFGQWQEDGVNQKRSNLEFYEYVEALKLTGDPRVPAGQVAFRAKVGKQYQLPHKGIIPEEFGVVARYKGQGRLAESGFKSPRWVDGELVILDGKYIKGGPVVGFVYWAPGYHFLVFYNRLRLPE